MKLLLRPGTRSVVAPGTIVKKSVRTELEKTESDAERRQILHDNLISLLSVNGKSVSNADPELVNEYSFYGDAAYSTQYLPSYATAKEHFGSATFGEIEIANTTLNLVSVGALYNVLTIHAPGSSNSLDYNYTKNLQAGEAFLRFELDTPITACTLGATTTTNSNVVTVNLVAIHEDGTESSSTYSTSNTADSRTTRAFKPASIIELRVERSANMNTHVFKTRTMLFHRETGPISTAEIPYPKTIKNVYAVNWVSISGQTKVAVQEVAITHDVADRDRLFMPRPEYQIGTSGYMPSVTLSAPVLLEGTMR